ncbi:hypothetical protein [Fluviicola sp.]|uniref:hypothetical protein n=1 Tax=Fluviicola sp. TaxID=1917219 RepID=UPI0031D41936
MNSVKEIISKHLDEFENFEYYFKIVEIIELNLESHPDISIESCKSLFEGISKTIILSLNPNISIKELETLSAQKLVRSAVDELGKYGEIEDLNFITVFVKEIATIRSLRGDISHGRPSPKVIESDSGYAIMVANTTFNFVTYLLQIFFNLKFETQKDYQYDNYPEFNEWLDEQDQVGFFKSYSLALYQTDYIRYEQELLKYYPDLE